MDNGHIIEGTSICVNYWKNDDDKEYLRFLTHFNSDFSCGFGSDFQECIHTSPLNAWLLINKVGVDRKYVVSLSVGDSYILCDESTKKNFSVTVIDANYNAGSVMFIFQGDFGNILYTGFFRYSMDMLQHPVLKSIIETKTMNTIYFDNTYAADHCIFPSKEETRDKIITILSKYPDHTIIFGKGNFGKEELLVAAANFFKEKIYASESELQVLSQLGLEEVFTTDSEGSRIMMLDVKEISIYIISKLKQSVGPLLTIILSAQCYTVLHSQCEPLREAEVCNIHIVPYSSHSSHSELFEFIHCVQPENVIPIIDVEYYKNLSQYLDKFWANIWKNYVVPSSIMFMTSRLDSPLNLSPPDATIFHSELVDGNDLIDKQNKLNNHLVSISHIKKHRVYQTISFESNDSNNENIEYGSSSERNVKGHLIYEEIKKSVELCNGVDKDFTKIQTNSDGSLISTDECSNDSTYLDGMQYESSISKDEVLSHIGQNCQIIYNNLENKSEKNINIDRALQQMCHYPLNTVNSKSESKTDTGIDLLPHVIATSVSTKAKCDKSTNTDKVSHKVRKNACNRNSLDIDIGLVNEVYEHEKRQRIKYNMDISPGNISMKASKEKHCNLNSIGSENCSDENEDKKISCIEKHSDCFSSSVLTEICRQSTTTPQLSVYSNINNGIHKRKLMDSVLYNKRNINKCSVTMSSCEKYDFSDSYTMKRRKRP